MSVAATRDIIDILRDLANNLQSSGNQWAAAGAVGVLALAGTLAASKAFSDNFAKIFGLNNAIDKISNIQTNLQNAVLEFQNIGQNVLPKYKSDLNSIKTTLASDINLINSVLGVNTLSAIDGIINLINDLETQIFNQLRDITSTLGLAYVARNDNNFRAFQKGKLDRIADAAVSMPDTIAALIGAVNAIAPIIDNLRQVITENLAIAVQVISPVITTPLTPRPRNRLEELVSDLEGNFDLD
jgi:hypothetical protein